jgi:hypothetical protein
MYSSPIHRLIPIILPPLGQLRRVDHASIHGPHVMITMMMMMMMINAAAAAAARSDVMMLSM